MTDTHKSKAPLLEQGRPESAEAPPHYAQQPAPHHGSSASHPQAHQQSYGQPQPYAQNPPYGQPQPYPQHPPYGQPQSYPMMQPVQHQAVYVAPQPHVVMAPQQRHLSWEYGCSQVCGVITLIGVITNISVMASSDDSNSPFLSYVFVVGLGVLYGVSGVMNGRNNTKRWVQTVHLIFSIMYLCGAVIFTVFGFILMTSSDDSCDSSNDDDNDGCLVHAVGSVIFIIGLVLLAIYIPVFISSKRIHKRGIIDENHQFLQQHAPAPYAAPMGAPAPIQSVHQV